MANTFWREPTNHGDSNIWADYLMNQVRRGPIGALTLELYDNGGALTLSEGYAGIDNGSNKGTIYCDAPNVISLAAITAGHWAQIELAVSGTSVTISATEMVEISEAVIPAVLSSAYVYAKQGYYIVATKRCVGIAYKTGAGALRSFINCDNNKKKLRNTEEKIGKIEQYDISTWADDSTKPGWYACIAANAAFGCPDMLDRVPQGKLVAGAGAAGGANTKVIASGNLPPHQHVYLVLGAGVGTVAQTGTDRTFYNASTTDGGFANTALDIENANYTMVFVRKCYWKGE